MKTPIHHVLALLISLLFFACDGSNAVEEINQITKEEIQKKKIQEIIPDQYLDSLRKLGLTINQGVDPVKVEGYFSFTPLILEATNIPKDTYQPGFRFTDAKIRLYEQDDDLNIKMLGRMVLAIRDTSIATAISGSGNNFTIYGKIKSDINDKTANFAVIMSGVYDGNALKNIKYGIICISNKNPEGANPFIKEGQGRLVFDSDLASERITESVFLALGNKQQQLQRHLGMAK
ncbi:hypothetical protein [Sphingobacterium hungaricum]|uniref:Lipoprotein n=1 Tax=Sphingobacterium hungaricum TaxID=2082723 RepID=A0A928UYI0_9SPHI|nr:hypothetical protein [Sphingobacterium hungaricum]MBE8715358.1 hypothetical protein [Sphingobacterium hungaricum]